MAQPDASGSHHPRLRQLPATGRRADQPADYRRRPRLCARRTDPRAPRLVHVVPRRHSWGPVRGQLGAPPVKGLPDATPPAGGSGNAPSSKDPTVTSGSPVERGMTQTRVTLATEEVRMATTMTGGVSL